MMKIGPSILFGAHRVTVEGNILRIIHSTEEGVVEVNLPGVIQQVAESPLDNGIIVLSDKSLPPKEEHDEYDIHNLGLISWKGEIVWKAQTLVDTKSLPDEALKSIYSGKMSDFFANFSIKDRILMGWTFSCYMNKIDLNTGKILESVFHK